MFRFPNLSNANVQGPFWEAKVRVLAAAEGTGGGSGLPLTIFDRFSRSLGGAMIPIRPTDVDFVESTVDGQEVISSPATRLTAAQTKPGIIVPDTMRLTGRFRVESNVALNENPAGTVAQVTFRSDVPGSRFYSVGIDTEALKQIVANQQRVRDFRFSLFGDPLTVNQMGGEQFFPLLARVNVWFHFRIDVKEASDGSRTEIAAKVWEDGEPEPPIFDVRATNSAPDRPRAKAVGLAVSGAGTKMFSSLAIAAGGGEFALRTLFTENAPRNVPDQNPVFVPHTFVALCEPLEVKFSNSTLSWTRAATSRSAIDLSEEEIRAALKSGALSLLMLGADPARLAAGRVDTSYRCVSGTIDLNSMQPQGQSVAELRRSVIGEPVLNSRAQLAVNASGLVIRDQVKLPWDRVNSFAAPFLLSKSLSTFRLALDVEHLLDAERKALLQAWLELSSFLNPKSPLNSRPSAAEVPQWMTLEIASPRSLPRFFREWTEEPWRQVNALAPSFAFAEGQFHLLLTDQQPDDSRTPPESLARLSPQRVSLRRESAPERLVVEVNQPLAGAVGLRYKATRTATGPFTETFTLADATLAYDPVETARALRGFAQLPTPQWERNTQPLEAPLLWGFMPLEDGWAQLPVANLTEQIYLDAKLVPAPSPSASNNALEGAVSFSNQRSRPPEEQSWSLTVTSGGLHSGIWSFDAVNTDGREGFRLASVEWSMQSPEVVIDGLLWLSTGKPSAQDALPDHSDWVSGLRSIPLRTRRPGDLFPAPWHFLLGSSGLSFTKSPAAPAGARLGAQLGAWQFTYRRDPAITQKLESDQVWPKDTSQSADALLWRRHARLPMIQALPMTQSQQPPNYPSASRQLVPFVVAGGVDQGWSFGVDAQGAAQFPSLKSEAIPEPRWAQMADLPLASLSVPGVLLSPAAGALVPQYRFDLPYTDEVNAFAEVPQVSAAAARPTDAAARLAAPLARDTFAPFWQRLADRASLAAADAVEAFPITGAPATVSRLIEPLTWIATPRLDTDYPGTLSLNGLALADSLEGLTANFTRNGPTLVQAKDGDIQIVSGSMASEARDSQIRDQRGLARSVTSAVADLVSTPVDFGGQTHELVSSTKSIRLKAGNEQWSFWFRDLPLERRPGARLQFERRALPHDVNDPEALSSSRNYLQGYEWRLGSVPALSLYQLDFFALTLERVEVLNQQVEQCVVAGRLQLPVRHRQEQEGIENVVKLTFTRLTGGPDGPTLVLTAIELVGSFVEWPLALGASTTESTTEPRLRWRAITLSGDRASLEMSSGALHYHLFGESWSIGMPAARFAAGSAQPVQLAADPRPPGPDPNRPGLFPQAVICKLEPATGVHSAEMTIAVRLGETLGFRSSVSFPLLGGVAPTASAATLGDSLSIGHLSIGLGGKPEVRSQGRSLQFAWDTHDASRPVQLLSGMHVSLKAKATGFAALTFDVLPAAGSGLPELRFQTAFVEALVPCAWGASLQEPGPGDDQRIFGSSAGQLTFAFSAELRGEQWKEDLLLNGFLEVKDLISWPQALAWDEPRRRLTLPASAGRPSLPHVRHTIRILLNQHPMPTALFARGATKDLMFQLADGKTWQFLAVVEHQLVEVTPVPPGQLSALGLPPGQVPPPPPVPLIRNDHRWTALQEVRIVRPAGFLAYLNSHADIPGDEGPGDEGKGTVDAGLLRRGLRTGLIAQLSSAPADMLLVEASAPHWIRQTPIEAEIQTTLQFLPGGSQQAILSTPADFASDPASAERWLLLTTPFLGRLQSQELDRLSAPVFALQVDPILRLQQTDRAGTHRGLLLALTSWSDTQDVTIEVAAADAQVSHLWPRLDPLSLEANWLLLQRPEKEPSPAGIRSVIAAAPDTPARLSRPVALRRAFDVNRPVTGPLPELEETGPLVWRQQSRMATQFANATPTTVPYGFHLVGLQMQAWLRSKPEAAGRIRRYPAVTVIPSGQATRPVSCVVSPYLGLGFLPAPAAVTPNLRSVELVCVDRSAGGLVPVASRLFDGAGDPQGWAQATRRLLAPESPIAVLRERVINAPQTGSAAGEAQLTASYSFRLLSVEAPEALTPRAFPLRATVAKLRFREGNLGAAAPPQPLPAFQLAPPQVSVQPLYLKERPGWPWGWSGLRFSAQHADRQAAIGDSQSPLLWWQAPHWITQFRSGQTGGSPVAGLPAVFRAPAILSLLPVLPAPPLPALNADPAWQPVLPGQLHYVITGGRAGTMMALRHQVIRQNGLGSVVSGSVPVQHRVPRPVSLPKNAQPDHALQTWASFLAPGQNARITTNPSDESLFLGPTSQPGAARLRLTLESHSLDPRSNGELSFFLIADGTLPAPVVKSLSLTDGTSTLLYQGPAFSNNRVVFQPKTNAEWQGLIGRQRVGAALWARVNVEQRSLVQTLSFELRVVDSEAIRFPLLPFYVHFEDPEYNRRLASSSARAAQTLRKGDVLHTVTLAADRQIYNPDSTIALRHDWDLDPKVEALLSISLVDLSGNAKELLPKRKMDPDKLESISLAGLGALVAGNSLELKLTVPGAADLVLRVSIVAEPVVPVPEAAYALLRIGSQSQVECVSFAWSPQASRVELVCADDLKSELVRRRAVFQWIDAARPKSVDTSSYAIQKIASNGSTHLPELPVLVPAQPSTK